MSVPYFCFEKNNECEFKCYSPNTLNIDIHPKTYGRYAMIYSYPFLPDSIRKYHMENILSKRFHCSVRVT